MPLSLIVAFEEGLTARDRGLTCDDNPYPAETPSHAAWDEGCLSRLGLDRDREAADSEPTS
jgi:hypothetical protein